MIGEVGFIPLPFPPSCESTPQRRSAGAILSVLYLKSWTGRPGYPVSTNLNSCNNGPYPLEPERKPNIKGSVVARGGCQDELRVARLDDFGSCLPHVRFDAGIGLL